MKDLKTWGKKKLTKTSGKLEKEANELTGIEIKSLKLKKTKGQIKPRWRHNYWTGILI